MTFWEQLNHIDNAVQQHVRRSICQERHPTHYPNLVTLLSMYRNGSHSGCRQTASSRANEIVPC